MFSRRDFIKLLSLTGATVLTPVRWFTNGPRQKSFLQGPEGGELYAGFLLLSEGEPVPDFVEYPNVPIPDGCGVEGGSKPSGVAKFYETPTALSKEVDFRVYLPNNLTEGLREGTSYTFSNLDGSIYEAWLAYEAFNSDSEVWEAIVFMGIQLFFPKPLPLWYVKPVEENTPGVNYEKVDFLPTAGLQSFSNDGVVYYWIDNDLFYKLVFEPTGKDNETRDFISSLKPSG